MAFLSDILICYTIMIMGLFFVVSVMFFPAGIFVSSYAKESKKRVGSYEEEDRDQSQPLYGLYDVLQRVFFHP